MAERELYRIVTDDRGHLWYPLRDLRAHELERNGRDGSVITPLLGPSDAMLQADAATAAERQRAIAIVERQPHYPDTHTGMRQQWVKDQILAALRGGDHE